MKKTLNALSIILSSLFLVSCNPISIVPIETKYAIYYQYSVYPGFELYCWKNKDIWESGILPAMNNPSLDKVKQLQDEHPCPSPYMKKIIATFPEDTRAHVIITITSMPPKWKEIHPTIDKSERREEYIFLYNELDLSIPNGIL